MGVQNKGDVYMEGTTKETNVYMFTERAMGRISA
jgi:hypothetical protein